MKLYAKKTTGNFPKRILTLEETKMILHPYLRDLLRYILCVTRKILHPIKCNLLIKCKVVTSQKRIYIDGRHNTLYFFTLRIFSTKTRIFFGKLRHPLVPRSKCFARYSTWKAKESSAVGWLWKGMEKKVSQAYDNVSMQNIKPIYKSSYNSPSPRVVQNVPFTVSFAKSTVCKICRQKVNKGPIRDIFHRLLILPVSC